MKCKRLLIAAGALSLLASAPAAAEFRYEGPSQRDINETQIFEQYVLNSGFHADLTPIKLVLQIIAGDKVKLDLGADLDPNMLVSFRGGRPRANILNEVLTPKGFIWHYRPGELIVRSKREVKLADVINHDMDKEDRFIKPVTWKVPANVTLEKVILEWASRARVSVNYKVKEPIVLHASATFQGSFLSAVDNLLSSMHMPDTLVMARFNKANQLLTVYTMGDEQ